VRGLVVVLVLVLVLVGPRRGAGPVTGIPRGDRMIAGPWHRMQGASCWAAVHPRWLSLVVIGSSLAVLVASHLVGFTR